MDQPEVLVMDYDPNWKKHFESIKNELLPHLSSFEIDIQHVGSTSVAGLAAKPVIDIDIIYKNEQDYLPLLKAIKEIGYQHLGDLGIKGRDAFKKIHLPGENHWFRHNLYLGQINAYSIQNHLQLRDFLRTNPDIANAYGDLKKKLAIEYANDRALYTEKKSDFILNVLSKLGFNDGLLKDIRDQNKA